MKLKSQRLLTALYAFIIFAGITKTYFQSSLAASSMPVLKKSVLIDAGHGGFDPGKVMPDGTLEKDINLRISQKLQMYLEEGGAKVLMTRTSDKALSEKKREDLRTRKEIANNSDADIFISIHQNYYPSENVNGAQVFYYNKSDESKILAECIQNRIKDFADNTNTRVAKENSQYYVLKQTKIKAVIVECGFLSNDEERKKLTQEDYQEKIAWAIYMGILDYYKTAEGESVQT